MSNESLIISEQICKDLICKNLINGKFCRYFSEPLPSLAKRYKGLTSYFTLCEPVEELTRIGLSPAEAIGQSSPLALELVAKQSRCSEYSPSGTIFSYPVFIALEQLGINLLRMNKTKELKNNPEINTQNKPADNQENKQVDRSESKTDNKERKIDYPAKDGILGDILQNRRTLFDIETGTNIDGVQSPTDLDLLIEKSIADAQRNLGLSCLEFEQISALMKSRLSKRGFNGQLREFSILVAANTVPNFKETNKGDLIRLIIECGLFSTARVGRVDTYLSSVTLGTIGSGSKKINVKFKEMVGKSGLAELDYLLDDSQTNWERTERERLQNIVSGGLPSLGKRR